MQVQPIDILPFLLPSASSFIPHMTTESSSRASKHTLEEGSDVGRNTKRPVRGARHGTAASDVEKKELPDELKKRIQNLVWFATPDDREKQDKHFEELKAVCEDVKKVVPNFYWSKFSGRHGEAADATSRWGLQEADATLLALLGGTTVKQKESIYTARQREKLAKLREKAPHDQTLLPEKDAKDPFSDTAPIQFNNKDLHTFDVKKDDVKRLLDKHACEVLKLILKSVNHIAVNLNTLDPERVIEVSNGLLAVLRYIEGRAAQKDSPVELPSEEKEYILLAKFRFSNWRIGAQKVKKDRSGV